MKKLLILIFIFLFFSCPNEEGINPTEPKDVIELLPLDNEISGWTRKGEMDVAENDEQLTDLINGEGQVFIDHGFVKFARQWYQGNVADATREIRLRIFDMGDTTNAKDVYDAVGIGTETPWTDNNAGVEARIDETLLFDYKIDFWDDRFYVWVTIKDEKTPVGLNVAKLFCLNVSNAIRDTTESD
ncbi:hypothetical protein AMJ52_03275 [candidate division TA06 bacterium DG_78]|uniref:Lipoprotein n=1 Tax=candidate division TA06 bacterium DG_78 TaxID=1703772 RepID=A0A0S7YGI4_UNCT6|nr:MAG: hypothetical protein AMJ52_03275 [candidate division TA06 bacterium DG_78]